MIGALKFWKEGLLVLLALALFAMWRSRERGLVERGQAIERARVADSILAVVRPQLARADTAVTRGAVTVTRYVDRWRVDTAWRQDTVRIPGDTAARIAVPVSTVARQDTTIRQCDLLAADCAAYRAFAIQTIAALESKLAAQPVAAPRSCTVPMILSALVGAGGGYVGGRISGR